MDHFGFFCLSFLLSFSWIPIQPIVSYRLETERLSPNSSGCVWLPVQALSNVTTTTSPIIQSEADSRKLELRCELRKLPVDFWNYTLSREQLEKTTQATVKCHNQLLFESFLHPNQNLFQFINLEVLGIEACKIRKLPRRLWFGVSSLRNLTLRTNNGDWSSSYGLEIDMGGFEGLSRLEILDLSWNNIWTLPHSLFCPLRNLRRLSLSHNRLSEGGFFNDFSSSPLSSSSSSPPPTFINFNGDCSLALQELDFSYNTLRRVTRSGFGRLRRLGELRLENNQIEAVEDEAFYGHNQLKLVNLSSNRLIALPLSLFNHGNQLQQLHLQNNSISALSPTLFTPLHDLLLLDLSRNKLSSQIVNNSIFSGLLRLIVLKISFNQLNSIDSNVFLHLMSLQSLHLENNQIETIHPEAFVSLSNLHLLDLSRNRLTMVDSRIFGNLFVLRQLYLDHNQIRRIDDTALVNTTSLRDFGLAGNLLSEVPVALHYGRGLTSIETLDLGENRITIVNNESFVGLGQIYGLRLVDNRLIELPSGFCNSLQKLHVLNLAQNKINKISSSAFVGCPKLRALRLDTNNLEDLPVSFSQQLPSLLWLNVSENRLRWADYHLLPPTIEWLDLSYNSLVTLGGVMSSQMSGNGPIQYHLRVLDASHNNLTHLDYTTIPPTLETLRLNANRLSTVAPDTFSRAGRLRRVELMGNQLESLPLTSFRLPTVESDKTLPELFLGGNSFFCDCSMEWLTRVNQLSLLRQYPRIVDIDAISCRGSGSRTTPGLTPLPDMTPTQFLCSYHSHCFALCQCCEFDACDCAMTCPGNCTCYHDSAWSANIVECSNLNYTDIPKRIPMDATELYLDGNDITSLGSHIFIGKKNLRVLYLNGSRVEVIRNKTFNGLKALEILRLENNYLTEIFGYEFTDLENLLELHLQNNRLESISSKAFINLKFLTLLRLDENQLMNFHVWELSGNGYLRSLSISVNPWSCDCEFIIPFRTWIISRASVVVDFGLATCQPLQNGSRVRNDRETQQLQYLRRGETKRIPVGSACTAAAEGISQNYALSEIESNNHILGDGDGVTEKGAIHHPHDETDDGRMTVTSSKKEYSGTLWALTFSFIGLVVLIVAIVLIFRKEVYSWCLRRLFLIDRLRRQESSQEKVTDSTNIFFSDESDKLFDAYFLYNRKDEELLTQKVTPELEIPQCRVGQGASGPLRLLLHYRDLCQNLETLSSSWNPDMTLSASESSKRVVVVLSKSFLQEELSVSDSRSTLQLVIQRYSQKLLFILFPPLNEGSIGTLYPELKNKNIILDWLDPNFWPKLRILLPTPRNYFPDAGTTPNHHQNNDTFYNKSLGSSNYSRNILPYQFQVPQHLEGAYGENSLRRNNSLPPVVPKHHIILPVTNWQTMTIKDGPGHGKSHGHPHPALINQKRNVNGPIPTPTSLEPSSYFSFADNFRFHQQHHHPYTFATLQPTPAQSHHHHSPNYNEVSKSQKGSKGHLSHSYRPLRQNPPGVSELLSPQSQSNSTTTEDSGNVNGSSSSDELENEHVYSTLDSPLQSPSENFCISGQPHSHPCHIVAGSPENRTMYFV